MKKELTNKQMFFKHLSNIIDKFHNEGIKETRTISLIYQVAFKMLEATNCIVQPMNYFYGPIDVKKEILKKFHNEINDLGHILIKVIKEDDAFNDLMSNFIEENESSNKRLSQYFTPNDVSKLLATLIYSSSSIEEFEEKKRKVISDPGGCGAGSLILASLQKLKNIEGFTDAHYQSIDVYMVDIDEDLAKIAFFQVILNSFLHVKPLGKIIVEAKNIITEFSIAKNQMVFIANIDIESKSINNPNYRINANKVISMLDDVFKKAA